MSRSLLATLRGVLASVLLAANTLFWCVPLFLLALLKFLLPLTPVQRLLRTLMHWCAESWISINALWMQGIRWDVRGLDGFDREHSYLITSNHQSWVDIFALQHQFNGRIPFLKFFLKQELIWVPVIGLCWWALEFPFMKRHSKEYLAKHPEKRGQDLATTRAACARFRTNPVSVFNFLEGTRFTPEKHQRQASPFRHLLKPKSGGIAFVLDAMGEQLAGIVDVTLHYPDGRPTYWDLACGQVPHIVMRVRAVDIPGEFLGRSYEEDIAYRQAFHQWVNQLWLAKDAELAALHEAFPPAAR